MKNKISDGLSKTPLYSLQEVLRHLVKIAGLQEMTLWRNRKKEWYLSVKVKHRPHVLYLARAVRLECHVPSSASMRP